MNISIQLASQKNNSTPQMHTHTHTEIQLSNLSSCGATKQKHLGQIQKAFLTTQQAFKNAAHARVREILDELDPGKISASGGGGLKFGPLRKAECFEIYESKFRSCKKWFESGRFMEDFLREFEKNCQKLSE